MPNNNFAIALRKNICESQEYETMKLNGQLAVGTSHVCRVKKFHLFDNLIEISLKKSFIEQSELSFDDFKIGTTLEGTLKKFKPNGVYIRLAFGVNGFIPNMHLTDAPLLNAGKNREKLFSNKKVKCRITRLDSNSRVPKISLTMKKSLLNMNESEIFSDISQIKPGMSSSGVVCLITENGVLLEFFGRVCGFIPLKYLATYQIDHPENVFSIGQVVKTTVVSVDRSLQRMVCSLIDVNSIKKLKVNTEISDKKLKNASLEVGQILKKMKIHSRTEKGFNLINNKQDIQVFLPLNHLSDDKYIIRLLNIAFKAKEIIIDKVMVFSKNSANVVTVTMKRSFLEHPHSLVTNVMDIKLNFPFPAVVRNITSSGIFFETPNSLIGVIRRSKLQDGYYGDPQDLGLIRGQTIYACATDLILRDNDKQHHINENADMKRFLFCLLFFIEFIYYFFYYNILNLTLL